MSIGQPRRQRDAHPPVSAAFRCAEEGLNSLRVQSIRRIVVDVAAIRLSDSAYGQVASTLFSGLLQTTQNLESGGCVCGPAMHRRVPDSSSARQTGCYVQTG